MGIPYKGARWYKCDLHLHTPSSKCFANQKVTPEEWLEAVLDKDLECIAITDHNIAGSIDTIKSVSEGSGITIFPGTEITCSDAKIHLLILFDINSTNETVNDFILRAKIDRCEFGERSAHSPLSIAEVAYLANEMGAIVIPAHIDDYNGLSQASYEIRNDFLELGLIDAVQIVNEEAIGLMLDKLSQEELAITLTEKYDHDIGRERVKDYTRCLIQVIERKKSLLTFSDNPCEKSNPKHGLWGIGNLYTWIKMGEKPDLESLRQAFILSDMRIKTCYICPNTPYVLPEIWIEKLIVKNIGLTEVNSEVIFEFSPQMTTIIGGRGSGKSSVIRLVRGLLSKNADIIQLEEIMKEQTDFFKIFGERDKSGILKDDTNIELIIYRNGNKYKISAFKFHDQSEHDTKIDKWDDNARTYIEIKDEAFIDFFEVDIFNQKQIYELAKTPNALRDRIDKSIEGIEGLLKNKEELSSRYIQVSTNINHLKQSISLKGRIITEVKDLQGQIEAYKTSGFEELLLRKQEYDTDKRLIDEYYKELQQKASGINIAIESFTAIEFNKEGLSEESREEIVNIIENTNKSVDEIASQIKKLKSIFDLVQKSFNESIMETNWNKNYILNCELFDSQKKSLEEKGIDSLSTYEELTASVNKKIEELNRIEAFEKLLASEVEQKDVIKAEYMEAIKAITDRRKAFLNKILANTNVSMNVKPFRDRQDFISKLRNIIQRQTGFEDDINSIANKCFTGSVEKQLGLILNDIYQIRDGNTVNYLGARFKNLVQGLNEEQISRLELISPEDEIEVKYRPNTKSGFKPLSNASAGQKTSAILTFLLSYGTTPLLLDQPEDDLDNHLIYDLIVERLKECKNSRQVIVVTHNANIPVNGDSEYVIAMNSEAKHLSILCSGTLEEDNIRKEICTVMEGGEEAFKLRSKRYFKTI